jgi:hypothetical protein
MERHLYRPKACTTVPATPATSQVDYELFSLAQEPIRCSNLGLTGVSHSISIIAEAQMDNYDRCDDVVAFESSELRKIDDLCH